METQSDYDYFYKWNSRIYILSVIVYQMTQHIYPYILQVKEKMGEYFVFMNRKYKKTLSFLKKQRYNRAAINYFVNNRRQDRGKSRLHFSCICPFLWTAHRFSPIEPNRVRLARMLWNFNVFSLPWFYQKYLILQICKFSYWYFWGLTAQQINLLNQKAFQTYLIVFSTP